MKPTFWKLSQGKDFDYQEIIDSVARGLVYVHKDTKPSGTRGSRKTPGDEFVLAPVGDYFYLTHGNKPGFGGAILLGQFSGPANLFSSIKDGWLDRPFRFILPSVSNKRYRGEKKRWTPNDDSTFCRVPEGELRLFEEYILRPYFDIKLAKFGIRV